MLFEYGVLAELTNKELLNIEPFLATAKDLTEILNYLMQTKVSAKRKDLIANMIKTIKHPPYSLDDSIEWLSDTEYALLGYAITCSKIDMYDIEMTNCTCKDFKNGFNNSNIILAGEIEGVNIVKTKSGKKLGAEMCFVTLSDNTGSLDSVIVFPEQFTQYKNTLFMGNVVIVKGNRSKTRDGLIVEKLYLPKS